MNVPGSLPPAQPFFGLHHAWAQARQSPNPESAMQPAVADFVAGAWADVPVVRSADLSQLPAPAQPVVEAEWADLLRRLRAAWRAGILAGSPDPLLETLSTSGERLVGMRLAGEDEGALNLTGRVAMEITANAYLALATHLEAHRLSAPVEALAGPLIAAVVAEAAVDPPRRAARILVEDRAGPATLASVAERLYSAAHRATETVESVLGMYARHSADVLGRTPEVARQEVRSLGALVAFASTARDGTPAARVDGAVDLFRAVGAMGRLGRGGEETHLWRVGGLPDDLEALRRLGRVIGSERAIYSHVEARWREIRTEMQYLQRRRGEEGADIVYPFPEEFRAVESRALFLHEAMRLGLPLGLAVAELADSPDLTFGPTERTYLERVAFYGARKYAADYATDRDEAVRAHIQSAAEEAPGRAEQLWMVLRNLERDMRTGAAGGDPLVLAETLLQEAVDRSDLRRTEAVALLPCLPLLALRVRALEEVRLLTAVVAVWQTVPRAFIEGIPDLPHTRAFVESPAPQTTVYALRAQNGQTLRDLERVTRVRWQRHRQQVGPAVDVETLNLDPAPVVVDAEDNPMRLSYRTLPRRPQDRPTDSRRSPARPREESFDWASTGLPFGMGHYSDRGREGQGRVP